MSVFSFSLAPLFRVGWNLLDGINRALALRVGRVSN